MIPTTHPTKVAAFLHVLGNVVQLPVDAPLILSLQQAGCKDICSLFSLSPHEVNQLTYQAVDGAILPVPCDLCALLHAFYAFVSEHCHPMNRLSKMEDFLALGAVEFDNYQLSQSFLDWYSSVPWNAFHATKPDPVSPPKPIAVPALDQAAVIENGAPDPEPVPISDPAVHVAVQKKFPIPDQDTCPSMVPATFPAQFSSKKKPGFNNANHDELFVNGEHDFPILIDTTIYVLPTANIDWGPSL